MAKQVVTFRLSFKQYPPIQVQIHPVTDPDKDETAYNDELMQFENDLWDIDNVIAVDIENEDNA